MDSLHFSVAEIFYLFGTFHGILLAIYLLVSRRKHKANIYLSLLICLFSFYLFENTLYSSGYITQFPNLLYTSLPLIYLLAPLFYLYTRALTKPEIRIGFQDSLHLLPFVIEIIILWSFYTLPTQIKLQVYDLTLHSEPQFQFSFYFAGYLIYVFSSLVYMYLSYRLLTDEGKSNQQNNIKLRWARQSGLVYFTYIALSLLLSIASFYNSEFRQATYHINLILQTFLIQLLGYAPFINPEAFASFQKNGRKYAMSSLNKEAISAYKQQLLLLMEMDNIYMDADISLENLAERLKIGKHHLSQVITEGFNTNFYDFINRYRIEKAKELMQKSDYSQAKLLHIAFDCGFSNKSTFIRSFKKNTGLTPSEFRKKTENLVSYN